MGPAKRTAGQVEAGQVEAQQGVSPEWYEVCRQAGFLLRPDSPALAKNWSPESGLEQPPWFDAEGNEIAYIGACPEVKPDQPLAVPEVPGKLQVEKE